MFEMVAARGESPTSTETVPAPAGQGATEGACREYATESQRGPRTMQGRSNAVTTFATGC